MTNLINHFLRPLTLGLFLGSLIALAFHLCYGDGITVLGYTAPIIYLAIHTGLKMVVSHE